MFPSNDQQLILFRSMQIRTTSRDDGGEMIRFLVKARGFIEEIRFFGGENPQTGLDEALWKTNTIIYNDSSFQRAGVTLK